MFPNTLKMKTNTTISNHFYFVYPCAKALQNEIKNTTNLNNKTLFKKKLQPLLNLPQIYQHLQKQQQVKSKTKVVTYICIQITNTPETSRKFHKIPEISHKIQIKKNKK